RTIDNGAPVKRTLTTGTLAGLHALVKSFTIHSVGANPSENAKVLMSQSFETALVPIFQFAVFYGNDLEIAPGPDMTLIGRVHSNGNLWLQADNSLQMDSYVTAGGNILHGRKGPGTVGTGDVLVKDALGNYVSMKEGSGWLEATDAHWYDSSVARWQGRVQDSTHGQGSLNVPLNGATGNPHALVERGSGNPDSYEHKATLKIIDGSAWQLIGGVWSDVTADMTAKGIISSTNNKFYDARELKWVDVTELDMQKVYDEGYAPANGVLYFSDKTGDFPGLRINNGEELGAPLTLASENPVYTLGNYNSKDKKPAAIMADAVTFLSGAWDDSKSSSTKDSRVAAQTTVNASFMTGNIETTDADYNGGFENLPRFLEVWSGTKFSWSGSMVNLWNSAQADGSWNGNYYSPPIRDWFYDTDLDDPNNLPPEAPVVRVFQRTGWKQEYVGIN
ncbi:MAG: hypothetical protein OEW00_07225, partial [candidate division Zixibacteria bacterium]|nr:hypothetical protein [candidate division Zixibacteria bacterium]